MKKVLVSIMLMLGLAAGANYAWAGGPDGNGDGTENNQGSSTDGDQKDGSKGEKREMSQREKFEYMILVGGFNQPRPRSVGSVEMTVAGPQIIVECYGIGNATLEVWESCGFCIESIEANTATDPIVYLTYPQDAGNYVLRVTGEDYYSEWEFEVRDNVGYIWQAFEL